jgi:hypothetical protein
VSERGAGVALRALTFSLVFVCANMMLTSYSPNTQEFSFALTGRWEAALKSNGDSATRRELEQFVRGLENLGFELQMPMPDGYDYGNGDLAFTAKRTICGNLMEVELLYKFEADGDPIGRWRLAAYQSLERGIRVVNAIKVKEALNTELGKFFDFHRDLQNAAIRR